MQYDPPHPGRFIKRVFLDPFSLHSNEVAAKLRMSSSAFNRLINGKANVSPVIALKLSKVLGRSPESWMSMQRNFDLSKARTKIDSSLYESLRFEN